ncbi:MAG: DUF1826 domain-containing protein [Ectothiorhodospiraceae bacterium]|nr:DUF1826 domain-containing protein [Ectothiorhodospiraceae bacterium]
MQAIAERERPHARVHDVDALGRILNRGVNLCVWQRRPDPVVVAEVEGLCADALPDVRCGISPSDPEADIRGLLERCGLRPGRLGHWVRDMAMLTERFIRLAPGRPVTLRLETLADDGCPRFHVDRTALRLVCTYRGPGTEWLSNDQVDRHALVSRMPNQAIIRSGVPARMSTHAVGIMKGGLFPGNETNGLVHRSPPIARSGQMRVLLCLDT